MAENIIYKDIDLSFAKTLQNDIPVITNGNAIKNSFMNNLMISSEEKAFDNNSYTTPFNVLHMNDSPMLRIYVNDMVKQSAVRDSRINKIENLEVSSNEDYRLNIAITLQVLLRSSTPQLINANILVNRY